VARRWYGAGNEFRREDVDALISWKFSSYEIICLASYSLAKELANKWAVRVSRRIVAQHAAMCDIADVEEWARGYLENVSSPEQLARAKKVAGDVAAFCCSSSGIAAERRALAAYYALCCADSGGDCSHFAECAAEWGAPKKRWWQKPANAVWSERDDQVKDLIITLSE